MVGEIKEGKIFSETSVPNVVALLVILTPFTNYLLDY